MPLNPKSTQRIGFALIENFALMSYASASEPLRAANLLSGVPLYEVVPLSSDAAPVASSSGLLISCKSIASEGARCHTIFVCAGGTRQDWLGHEQLVSVLRRLSRQGIRIGAISSGAYILAAAGLLDNRDFTIHWEHAPILREAFPHLTPRQARYVLDGDRITCGGGIAPLDMMHAIIGERMGPHFARRVSDWYLHTAIAEPGAPQRGAAAERFGTNHPALLAVLEKMEASVERPLSRSAMAAFVDISVRHLDRLFASEMHAGFLDTYRRIRLDHARRLLEQSPLSVSEIAFATGFSSAGHFSRAFASAFGRSPRSARKRTLRGG
ncbi:GlxA family transcriptional regulator [Bradyrhizobium sp. B097]|uniref:GlxA family transcriptional regulator n=1 Tax=Bradyrhizobium sp. B097 TaxID=3140244 RepID=UPI0031843223